MEEQVKVELQELQVLEQEEVEELPLQEVMVLQLKVEQEEQDLQIVLQIHLFLIQVVEAEELIE
jgi:hypothetical protein